MANSAGPQFDKLIGVLQAEGVEFILVGGLAGIAHGAARATYDVDIVYARSPENIKRLVKALGPHRPYLRGAPLGLPFRFDAATIRSGLNFTLTTKLGDLDILAEIAGGGSYEDLLPYSQRIKIFGELCAVLGLEMLIQVKRAAGRPKDLEALAELEGIRDQKH